MRVKWRGDSYKYLRLRIIPPFACLASIVEKPPESRIYLLKVGKDTR